MDNPNNSAILYKTIDKFLPDGSPLRTIFNLLNGDQFKKLIGLLGLTPEKRKEKIQEFLKSLLDSEVVNKIRDRLLRLATATTWGYILFTYLPLYLLLALAVIILCIYHKLDVMPAAMILIIGAIVLFFFSILLYVVARQQVFNLFALSSLERQLEEIIVEVDKLAKPKQA